MELSEQQRVAAERLGQDVCVVAGPGAGKTRVLTARFIWLVRRQGVSPDRILAITFTEKAANNIQSRLVEECEADAGLRQAIERAWVSTIHGFCARLLRENAVAGGLDVDFTVLDESHSAAILAEEADRAIEELFEERPAELIRVLESVHTSSSPLGHQKDLAESLLSVYKALRVASRSVAELDTAPPSSSRASLAVIVRAVEEILPQAARGTTPTQVERYACLREWVEKVRPLLSAPLSAAHLAALNQFKCSLSGLRSGPVYEGLRRVRNMIQEAYPRLVEEYFAPCRAVLVEVLRRLDARYRGRKRALSALDFADLEEQALALLREQRGLRERVQEKFDYILMDELQDTNPLQWRIVDLVRRPGRFFAVGDVNQAIYGFRHADPGVFYRYRQSLQDQGSQVDELVENYRSRSEILGAVTALTEGAGGLEQRELTAERAFPPLGQPAVEVLVAWGEDAAGAESLEAAWIANRIRELEAERPGDFRRFAVLARKRQPLEAIAAALRDSGIPVTVVGGRTLLETREVRDLLQFLGVLANRRDEVSLAGALRSPLGGVSDETLLRLKLRGDLWRAIAALDEEPAEAFPAQDLERLVWFRGLVRRLRALRHVVAPDRLLATAADQSGYLAALDSGGRNNAAKFLALLRDMHQDSPRSLPELFDELERLRRQPAESEAPPGEADNAVRLMTIHAAKGLEFPVVFVAAMHRGGANAIDPICYHPERGLGVKWRDPTTGDGARDSTYAQMEEEIKQKTDQEEYRLLYVAMTRAEERLILTQATHPAARGGGWAKFLRQRLSLDGRHDPEREWSQPVAPGGPEVRIVCTRMRPAGGSAAAPAAEEHPTEVVEPPVWSAQHDSALPVTHLGDFLVCPRRYYLARYLGFGRRPRRPWDEPGGSDAEEYGEAPLETGAADIGIQVHQLLAGVALDRPDPEAARLVEAFHASELARRIRQAAPIEREFDFAIEVDGVILSGRIDAWFKDKGRTVLVDYKTDDFDPDLEPARLAPYQLQLRLYALALERLTESPPGEALLHFLRPGKSVPVALDHGTLEGARDIVRRLREAQQRVEFPLREGEHCFRCAFYRGLCPAGQGG